ELDTVECLIRAVISEREDLCSHVRHVVLELRGICVLQDLVDEVHRRLGAGMNLLSKVLLDQSPETSLRLDRVCIDHFFLLERQPTAESGYWHVVALAESSPTRRSEERRVGKESRSSGA